MSSIAMVPPSIAGRRILSGAPFGGVQRIRTVTDDRRARPLGVVAGLVVLAALVAGIPLLAADPRSLVSFVSYGLVGGLLVVRRPRNPIAYPTVPAAIWVAVTRYRLFEIDRLIAGRSRGRS